MPRRWAQQIRPGRTGRAGKVQWIKLLVKICRHSKIIKHKFLSILMSLTHCKGTEPKRSPEQEGEDKETGPAAGQHIPADLPAVAYGQQSCPEDRS